MNLRVRVLRRARQYEFIRLSTVCVALGRSMNNLLDNMRSLKNRELKTVLVYQVLFFSLCLVNKSSASNRSHHQYYEYHADHANRIRPAAVKLLRMNEGTSGLFNVLRFYGSDKF